MPINYPIKVVFHQKEIASLYSFHFKKDFIYDYNNLLDEFTREELPNESRVDLLTHSPGNILEIDRLSLAVERHIQWLQARNYIIRHTDELEDIYRKDCELWVNVPINIQLHKGYFERFGKITSLGVFFLTTIFGEVISILSARVSGFPYAAIVPAVIADFTMTGLLFAYSGATSNLAIIGRKLDNWIHSKIEYNDDRESESSQFCNSSKMISTCFSLQTLSRLLLFIPPLVFNTFLAMNYWQSVMSIGEKAVENGDKLFSPELNYALAMTGTILVAMYGTLQNFSYAFKPSNTLEFVLNKCYNKLKFSRGYSNINPQIELESSISV